MPKGVYPRPTLIETLETNSERKDSGCIEWLGPFSPRGYGHVGKRQNGRTVTYRTHRLAYELANGPIPAGLVVRHKCDNPPCLNLDHLELGTPYENAVDRDNRGRNAERRKVTCPQGHPYDETNTYVTPNGARKCRTCNRARVAAHRQLEVGR